MFKISFHLLLVCLLSSISHPKPATAQPRKSKPASVWVYKGPIRVWTQPRFGAPQRGTMVKAGRFPVMAVLPPGGGCKHPWYKLGPEAFACSGWLIKSPLPPTRLRDVQATTRHGPWVLNRSRLTYYYQTLNHYVQNRPLRLRKLAGFRILSRRLVGNRAFFHVASNGLVLETSVRAAPSSSLTGVAILDQKDLPLVFVTSNNARMYRMSAAKTLPTDTTLPRYTARRLMERKILQGSCFYRVSPRYYIQCKDATVAAVPPPPPPAIGAHEPWLDLDGPARVLYGRKGSKVVRVMLVSLAPRTPGGLFRITEKHVDLDIYQRFGDDPYFLQQVPYMIFFHQTFALHAAYWHDAFGVHVSHGCINLSTNDARWVFLFLKPALPLGYRTVSATSSDPGSFFRIRGQRKTVRTPWSKAAESKPMDPPRPGRNKLNAR